MNAMPFLRPGHAVGESLRAIANHILSEARAALTDTAQDKAVSVHDFRKTMKWWRAMLRLLEPFLGDGCRQLRLDARDLAASLSSTRDVRSALDALADLKESGLLPAPSVSQRSLATIEFRLEQARAACEASIWSEQSRQSLMDALAAAADQVARWNLDAMTFHDLAQRLAQAYRRAKNAVPDDWLSAPAEELHELRKRVVIHRYQMEFVEPMWPRLGRIWVEEAQRLRNRLGKHQDLAVLARLTGPHQPLAHWRSRLAPMIARHQADHATFAARIAARLFAEPPKTFRRRIEALWEAQGNL